MKSVKLFPGFIVVAVTLSPAFCEPINCTSEFRIELNDTHRVCNISGPWEYTCINVTVGNICDPWNCNNMQLIFCNLTVDGHPSFLLFHLFEHQPNLNYTTITCHVTDTTSYSLRFGYVYPAGMDPSSRSTTVVADSKTSFMDLHRTTVSSISTDQTIPPSNSPTNNDIFPSHTSTDNNMHVSSSNTPMGESNGNNNMVIYKYIYIVLGVLGFVAGCLIISGILVCLKWRKGKKKWC